MIWALLSSVRSRMHRLLRSLQLFQSGSILNFGMRTGFATLAESQGSTPAMSNQFGVFREMGDCMKVRPEINSKIIKTKTLVVNRNKNMAIDSPSWQNPRFEDVVVSSLPFDSFVQFYQSEASCE